MIKSVFPVAKGSLSLVKKTCGKPGCTACLSGEGLRLQRGLASGAARQGGDRTHPARLPRGKKVTRRETKSL